MKKGYVSLLSILFLGVVGVTIVTYLLIDTISTLNDVQVISNGTEAQAKANQCAEDALQQVADNSSYTGTNTINFSNGSCTYTVTGSTDKTIDVSATINGVVRKISITTSDSGVTWEEYQ